MWAVLGSPGRAFAEDLRSDSSVPPQPRGVLGADYNQDLVNLRYPELRAAGVRWVRGFFTMPEADAGDLADNPTIKTILTAARRGYGTVLTLKFPYNTSPMPAPGGDAMALALERLEKVLPLVMDRVDILEIGNEPFIESRKEDRNETLNVFYQTMAQHVIAYRQANHGPHCRTRLYMGALNRLDIPANQTRATEQWMTFVRETPEIDGVDIHPHVPSPQAPEAFLDYILPRMRADQTFLVTEFSLVWYWQKHMTDQISPDFASRYGFRPDTQAWQVIQAAIEQPFPQEQWDDFFATSPWFVSQKYFLRDQVTLYRSTGRLAVATYGFRQDNLMEQNWSATKPPWLINSVFDPYTVQPGPHGLTGYNSAWLEQMRELQRAHAGHRM